MPRRKALRPRNGQGEAGGRGRGDEGVQAADRHTVLRGHGREARPMNRCGLALDQDDGLDSRDAHGARYLPYHEFRRGRRTIRALATAAEIVALPSARPVARHPMVVSSTETTPTSGEAHVHVSG